MRTTSWFIKSHWLAIMKEKLNGDKNLTLYQTQRWLLATFLQPHNGQFRLFLKEIPSLVCSVTLKRMCVCVYSHAMVTSSILHLKLLVHLWAELLAQITFLRSKVRSFQTLTHVRITVQLGLPLARAGVWGRHHLGDFGAGTHLSH